MSYTPLQVFSEYDLLRNPDSTIELVKALKKRGFQAAVLANHDYLYGAEKFRQAAISVNIRPIIGLTISDTDHGEVIFVSKNYSGYQNLMKISTYLAFNKNSQFILKENNLDFSNLALIFQDGKETKIKNSSSFTRKELGYFPIDWVKKNDSVTASALQHIEKNELNFTGKSEIVGKYLKDENFYASNLPDEILKNNQHFIADIVDDWPKSEKHLPIFPLPDSENNPKKYLSKLVKLGLENRFKNKDIPEAYQKRIDRELRTIFQLDLADYFLVVWDIINFARHENIQLGAGRGSAVGSLVAYALYITTIDPIKYDLYFERFLNPKRIQLPDIDIDVPGNRRQEIVEYLQKKYSLDNFSQIGTFDTFKRRLAVRDSARIFASSEGTLKRFSRFMAQNNDALEDADPNNLPETIAELPNSSEIISLAQSISGLPRHVGIHAAGIVLSPEKLVNYVPLNQVSDITVTQFDKDDVEAIGLVKFDLLRLTNLDMIADIRSLIQQHYGKKINLDSIDLNDKKVLDSFKNLQTNGIFQFESESAKSALKQIAVSSFDDIVAVNALNRPGPSENIPIYAQGKKDPNHIEIIDKSLQKILLPTYGVIIYQEQVMQIAQVYAGFTLGEADVFRAAIGHKNEEKLFAQHDAFIKGAVEKGHQQEQAEEIFAYIERFANYGFNKSHAVAYSKLAFEMAYLKIYFPLEFFSVLLNYDTKNSYLQDIKNKGIKLLGPDINHAERGFISDKGVIYVGLGKIKGLNRKVIDEIVKERNSHGLFSGLTDFLQRMAGSDIGESDIVQLTYAGSLDHFGYNRQELKTNAASLITAMEFGGSLLSETKISAIGEMSLLDRLAHEKEVLGFTISGHPIDSLRKEIVKKGYTQINDLKADQIVKMAVMIDSIRTTRDKNGNQMAFVSISDGSGESSLTVFAREYSQMSGVLKNGSLIALIGRTQLRNGEINIIANKIQQIGH
ncbi:DNA polymerase III subunit alpha [Oenococcus oeni]|uniref:DNA polymerase III subunit alpha n=1 Tax=Oenococcus oeni TaxID=1247 RepID=UPI000277BC51|nr:DNA polymerase III subunit alpha [Oenococcus oeni]EJN98895.1 DNA polymerase III, alpha subunit [Oenococcus oeni AWRIB419]KEK02898.1 DNA polymerase III subunit alpha [Oenococcus oeni]KER93470.1 DNA polymerase III subunit alpha [Oenococcus oeni]KER95795.1 DNA polymerase III subunit alpha [Oenococcus oeni]KGH57150.1 DNA polymerase III subunit alpha [Oenococcus oeni IOEB_B10]